MAFNKFKLTGHSALITGAAGLLGGEHAAALLECGASVILTDIDMDKLSNTEVNLCKNFDPTQITLKKMDVTDPDSIDITLSELRMKNIDVQILINNAAIDPKVENNTGMSENSRLENFSLKQWDMEIAVGLTGAYLCSQRFGAAMANSNKGGVILNIASDLSVSSPDQRLYRKVGVPDDLQPVKPVTYSVIKHGLIGLTKYLSTYWANEGIRCNALSPGGILNGQNEEFVSKLSSLIPLGRMAARDEYRAAVQFLCSDASSYMNGQNIVMDGGRSIW
jgi:NAD(P)-dependent dehydrogenase (short-subunit alcohol dehydrogenase family)